MKEIGEVVKEDNDLVVVRVNRREACGKCNACSLGMENFKYIELSVLNTVNAKKGDFVELDTESSNILLAAFIIYTFPLISMLVGLLLSYYFIFKNNAFASAIISLLCLALSFIIIKLKESKIKKTNKFSPIITRIIDNDMVGLIK